MKWLLLALAAFVVSATAASAQMGQIPFAAVAVTPPPTTCTVKITGAVVKVGTGGYSLKC